MSNANIKQMPLNNYYVGIHYKIITKNRDCDLTQNAPALIGDWFEFRPSAVLHNNGRH